MSHKDKLQTIQASRGVAALMVLLYHLTLLAESWLGVNLVKGIFRFGASGVDFFFVLSGFIIAFIHHQDIANPEHLWVYIRKRIVRVYPLYWVIAFALLPIYFSPYSTALSPSSYAITLFKSVFLLPQAYNPVVMVGWTLTFEVFFYSVFALAIYFSKPVTRILVVFWLGLSFISYLDKMGLAGPLVSISPARVRFLAFVFNFYNLEFAMGCLVAFTLRHFRIPHAGKLALIAGTIFIIAGMLESFSDQKFFRVSGVVYYGIPAALFILGAVSWEMRGSITLPAPLLFVGNASYSIYLTHYAVLDLLFRSALLPKLSNTVGSGITLVAIMLGTVAAGLLCYLLVERPLLAILNGRIFVNQRPLIRPQVP